MKELKNFDSSSGGSKIMAPQRNLKNGEIYKYFDPIAEVPKKWAPVLKAPENIALSSGGTKTFAAPAIEEPKCAAPAIEIFKSSSSSGFRKSIRINTDP